MSYPQIQVRQLMTDKPIKVSAAITVKEAAALMKKNSVGSLLVGGDDNLIGIVTETDVVQKSVAEDQNPHTTLIESIMSYPIMTIESDRSATEAADTMVQNGIRHLAVTEKERVVGLLSMRDLFQSIVKFQERSEA